jgi:hypothetical protein
MREISALQRFVEEARIDDVMVFANVEEINTGHMSFEEQDTYLALIKKVQEVLNPKGITTSINHWHTLMHADLGKKLREGQNFRLMVDPLGNRAELCVCPLCEEWKRYIAEIYARYAALQPEVLWVEDDFRLHNHAPLIWGGCFCEEHMRIYSDLAGKELTREEFVAGILEPGGVHPYRKIWLDVSRKTMIENARLIGDVVHSVSGSIKVGLMSSAPQDHAAEGRDWAGILRGLAGDNVPVDRIHLPGYIESSPSVYMMNFNGVSMLTRALVPPETEIYPELENFPYSRFTKSRRFTRFQLLASMPLNLSGVTIDLYDLNGNGIVWEENYQKTLRDVKDYLNCLTELGVFKCKAIGIRIMYSPDSSYNIFTCEGKAMEELYPQEVFFGSLFSAFGIPFAYCSDPSLTGDIVAVSGQYFRNLDAEQIRHLFMHNFVILDGEAAFTLYDLKLGELANIKNVRWMKQNEGEYAFEQVVNGKSYCGMEDARASALLLCSDAIAVDYGEGAEHITGLYDSYRRLRAPGCTIANENVLVYPFGGFEGFSEMPRMLLNNIRQAVIQDVVAKAGERFNWCPFVVGDPYVIPYCYRIEGGIALYLVNAATDGLDRVRLHMGNHEIGKAYAFGSKDGREREIGIHKSKDIVELELSIDSMEAALVTLYNKEYI